MHQIFFVWISLPGQACMSRALDTLIHRLHSSSWDLIEEMTTPICAGRQS